MEGALTLGVEQGRGWGVVAGTLRVTVSLNCTEPLACITLVLTQPTGHNIWGKSFNLAELKFCHLHKYYLSHKITREVGYNNECKALY